MRLQPILLGLGFALLIAISVATALMVDRAATDSRRLAETLVVQDQLSDVLLGVRRAESSQRGYLYTGNPSYLDDFRAAEPQVNKVLAELEAQAKSNSGLQPILTRIKPLVAAKFSELADTIILHEKGDRGQARAVVLGGKGRRIMAALQQQIVDAISQERQLAAKHSAQTHASSERLFIVSLIGAGLIVVIGALSVLLMRRNARSAEAARTELALTNANLERIVAHRTEDLTEANEEIQRFAYIVSHDLRSPLVNIMGFTSELEELRKDVFEQVEKLARELESLKAKSPEAEGSEGAAEEVAIEQLGADFDEALSFIKGSTANMDRLINAVLTLSREGRREFHPEPVDVNALVGSLVDGAAHRAMELGATIDVNDLPGVQSDP
ncbi:MAG TPA: CHASE3 domain-containing protein, partial [Pseudolabrys sp.]|nr:CHASE3 domain-containing protein [Pseudolabrys sp.]